MKSMGLNLNSACAFLIVPISNVFCADAVISGPTFPCALHHWTKIDHLYRVVGFHRQTGSKLHTTPAFPIFPWQQCVDVSFIAITVEIMVTYQLAVIMTSITIDSCSLSCIVMFFSLAFLAH